MSDLSEIITLYKRGDRLAAAQISMLARYVKRANNIRGPDVLENSVGFFIRRQPGTAVGNPRVKVLEIHDDWLLCEYWTWDGDNSGTVGEQVKVAKRWLLRKAPFHNGSRGNFSYVYHDPTDSQVRTSTGPDGTLIERVVPRYEVGDVMEIQHVGHSGVLDGGEAIAHEHASDSRAWSERFA